MTTIKFAQDNIFEKGIGKYDLCVFYGHHNMAFGLGYSLIKEKYKEFKITENPFETMPSKPIIYADKKAFVCVPHDFMSNENLRIDLTYWLKYATDNNLKTIAITGVRDIAKKEIIDNHFGDFFVILHEGEDFRFDLSKSEQEIRLKPEFWIDRIHKILKESSTKKDTLTAILCRLQEM